MNLKVFRRIFQIAYLKTVYFNFHFFSFSDAIKLPFIIGRGVRLESLKGKIHFKESVRSSMMVISNSKVIIDGILEIGHSCKYRGGIDAELVVGPNGKLEIGNWMIAHGTVKINCLNNIIIKDSCLFAHNIEISDTDYHSIIDIATENTINLNKKIEIGSHVWVGGHVSILKGCSIANGCIVATKSLVSKNLDKPNSIYGGIPAKIIKENVKWDYTQPLNQQ